MTDQRELFPGRQPRKWTMLEAFEVLEANLIEAARLGMTGKDADDWARRRTWETVEGAPRPTDTIDGYETPRGECPL